VYEFYSSSPIPGFLLAGYIGTTLYTLRISYALRQAYVHCEQGIKIKLLDTGANISLIGTEKLKKQICSTTQMKL
jgi:hypothetical protein